MLSQPLAVQPNLFTAMTLAPAVLASWVVLLTRPTRRTVAAAAALLALQFSTGGTQIAFYTIYAIGLLLPFVSLASPRSDNRRKSWIAVVSAVVLAFGLIAALVLPTLSVIDLSSRATGRLTLAETVPFPTPSLSELGRQLLTATPGPPRIFFGWTALVLALFGLVRPIRGTAWAGVVLITLVGTLLVLGPHTPAYAFYYLLPTGSWFRSPERAAVLIALGIALLAACGVERLHRRGWHLAASILLLLPIFELFRATSNWLPYPQVRAASAFAPPPILDTIRSSLGSGRAYVALNWQDRFPFMEKLGTWQGLAVAQDYDSLTPAVYGDYFRALLGPNALVDPIFAGRYHPLFGNPVARRAMDMLAVKLLVIAPGAQVRWMLTQPSAPPGAPPLLLENRTALPRAYVVHRVRAVENQDEALRAIADPRFDPTSTAVVIGGEEIDLPAVAGNSPVELVKMDTDAVTLRAQMDRSGLLVLNDLMFPGWEAWVDSEPARIFRVNVLFRGVYLDGGEHVVEFTYRPPRFVLGAWVSGMSIVVLLVMLAPRWGSRPPL
jgi:hypothetical protein